MATDDSAKERLFAAGRDLFFREGFARTSVDRLTAELGMSKKTFYKFFKSKEDLVGQIMERTINNTGARITLIANDAHLSFLEKLNLIMRELGLQLGRFGQPLQLDLQRVTPEIWRRIETFRRDMLMANVSQLLRQGKTEGAVQSSLNERLFMLAYLSAINGVIRPSVLAEESFSAHEAIQSIMLIFFAGILTDEGVRRFRELRSPHHSQQD